MLVQYTLVVIKYFRHEKCLEFFEKYLTQYRVSFVSVEAELQVCY